MIHQRSLRRRFFLAGSLLAVITIGTGLWSIATFVRLSQVVDRSLAANQPTLDLAAELSHALEREDDALLRALSDGSARAGAGLAVEQNRSDDSAERLKGRLNVDGPERAELAAEVDRQIAAYRREGANLLEQSRSDVTVERYHGDVNPLLRSAVQACGAIRERHFDAMRRAGIQARDQARRATGVVALVCLTALLLATVVAAWLARSVVAPVRRLTESVEAVRRGEFDRRVELAPRPDELGQLAEGFNKMAEALAEYRRSSLGELIAAKTTLEATLNALPDAVFVVAPDGTLATLNPLARSILAAKPVSYTHLTLPTKA